MKAIFFDLETTSLNPIGQILNYSFIEVDHNYVKHSELSGKIELCHTQIPDVGAIRANCIDIDDHMQGKYDSEYAAMGKIHRYLSKVCGKSNGSVLLVGQNIHRFDIHFLRTSMIRNGFNPYIRNIMYADTKFTSKKAFIENEQFRELLLKDAEESTRIFSLEHMCQSLGFLTESQQHESRADVLLTIELSKKIWEHGVDIFAYDACEVKNPKVG